MGTRRSHKEQGQGSRAVVGMLCFTRNSFVVTTVGRGVVVVQDPVARAPLLMAMSVHSIAETLQDCFVEFLIYRLTCRDKLMINQPVNVEERNQHGLDIGLHLPRFVRLRR